MFARRASSCSSLPTLPSAASAALVSSPAGGCCFQFLVNSARTYIRTYRYISISVYIDKEYSGGAGRLLSFWLRLQWLKSRTCFLWSDSSLISSEKICCHDDWGVVWAFGKSFSYAYIVLLPLQQKCRRVEFLFVVVCRMANVAAGSLNMIPAFSFSWFKQVLVLMITLGSTAVSHFRPRYACNLGDYGHMRI